MRPSRALLACAFLALAGPSNATPQAWKEYSFPQAGFAVEFPAPPSQSATTFHTIKGRDVPAQLYAVTDDGISYSVTVADFSAADETTVIDDAIAALKQTGQILVDTNERVDRNYGHDITLAGKDGSRSAIALFFADNRLYELVGRAANADGSAKTARFQQTLLFINRIGQAPRRPEDGLGAGGPGRPGGPPPPGGPGGRRGPPPPQAFADCQGKSEGASVQHHTPDGGIIPATCVTSPQGLFARPNAPGF